MNERSESAATGFATGFFLGSVAGMASMFLFGTKQGQSLLVSFQEELEKAGVFESLDTKDISLPKIEEKVVSKAIKKLSPAFPKFHKQT